MVVRVVLVVVVVRERRAARPVAVVSSAPAHAGRGQGALVVLAGADGVVGVHELLHLVQHALAAEVDAELVRHLDEGPSHI